MSATGHVDTSRSDLTTRAWADSTTEPETPKRRRVAFRVLATLVVLVGAPLFIFGLADAILSWLPGDVMLDVIDDPEFSLIHRAHYQASGVLAWVLFPAMAVQLRKPQKRGAAMLLVFLVFWLGGLVYLVAGGFVVPDAVFMVASAGLLALHPGVRNLLRVPTFDRTLLILAAVAAVPTLTWAFGQAQMQHAHVAGDLHAAQNHWSIMAVLGVAVITAAVLGASDHIGWRYTAGVAALVSIDIGAHALVWPGYVSSLPTAGALAAIAWGIAYGVAAMRRSRAAGASA